MNFVLGDMRRLHEIAPCDYGLLVDSFGFFESDEENEKVIRQLRRAVVSAGRLVIAVVNGTKISSTFNPRESEQREGAGWRSVENSKKIAALLERRSCYWKTGAGIPANVGNASTVSLSFKIIAHNGFRCRQLYGGLLGGAFSEETSEKVIMICANSATPLNNPFPRDDEAYFFWLRARPSVAPSNLNGWIVCCSARSVNEDGQQ